MAYSYPLHLRFKLIALAPRIHLTDAQGNELLYIKQKVLALKEDVRIFRDSSESQQVYQIKADRVLDFSAEYHFTDTLTGRPLGSIKHKGFRSIWRATYNVMDENGQQTHQIREGNPWAKVADAVLGEIPVLGFFTGYLFHPHYIAYNGAEQPVMRLEKVPSFWERAFDIHKLDDNLTEADEQRLLLAFLMAVQLERSRG